jgi:hypothetical protein
LGSVTRAMSFMRPLQLGHCKTSWSNVLFRSSAHPRYADVLCEKGSAADGSASCAMGSGCGLMRVRHALAGASTAR